MKYKESDIAKHFIDYFNEMGYEVFPEVPIRYGGVVDFFAVQKPVYIAVEVKTDFNLKVLEQAIRNKEQAHYSYIAVPQSHSNKVMKEMLCKDYGVGLLTASGLNLSKVCYGVNEQVKARLNRKIKPPELHDWMKKSVSGSQNERVTAFGNMVASILHEINNPSFRLRDSNTNIRKAGDPITLEFAFKHCIGSYYKTLTAARSNIYQWCRTGVIKDFYLERGMIYLGNWKDGRGLNTENDQKNNSII